MNWVPPPGLQGGPQNHYAHHGSSHAPSPPPAACTQLYRTEFIIPTHAITRHCCKESLFFLTHVIVKVAPGSIVRPPSLLFDMVRYLCIWKWSSPIIWYRSSVVILACMLSMEDEDCYSDLHRRWVKTTPQATQQLKDEGINIKIESLKL